jgi:S-DNA-T family DNA segregation ATPase FtsK/SpoIIIE
VVCWPREHAVVVAKDGLLRSRPVSKLAKAVARRSRGRRDSADSTGSGFAGALAGEVLGVCVLGLAALAALALATRSPSDVLLSFDPVANAAGVVGANLAGALIAAMGWGSAVMVAALAFLGVRLVLGQGLPAARSRFWVGSTFLVVAVATLPPILDSLAPGRLGSPEGGLLGESLASGERMMLSAWGALLLNGLLFAIGVLSVTGISTGAAFRALGAGASVGSSALARISSLVLAGVGLLSAGVAGAMRQIGTGVSRGFSELGVLRARRLRRERVNEMRGPDVAPVAIPDQEPRKAPASKSDETVRPSRRPGGVPEPVIIDHDVTRKRDKKPEQVTFPFPERGRDRPFRLPDSAIFGMPPADSRTFDRDSLLMNSRILEKKLADFGVQGRVVRVHPGPVITMYEYEPAAGIKVNKIVGLTDDLAMALRAISIRIIAPLPGKSVVGIEVPNAQRDTVYLRTVLESEAFRKHESALAVAMGMDIFGNPVISDLAKMPHLLVAGSTGTGKSVFLNSFLCSLLCRATPDQLKLLLVDPKLLELSIYEGIPHLIADVVTNPKRAAAALQGIVRKMEERYQMMSAVQVRNIDQFNAKAREQIAAGTKAFRLKPNPGAEQGDEVPWAEMPFIVVVIDELADLMVMVAKDVEESLQRLAQMARAAGIHLVLATQRPSVDVLTGVIKANFPSRVSFQVSSAIDSRTILDQKGAENLLGMGDLLFLPPRTAVLERLHAPFVSEKEVVELVAFLRDQGKPIFDDDLVKLADEGGEVPGAQTEDVDEMFDQAVAVVSDTRNASISYVQRRLKIGYNRAARIIEHMENEGMIGPQVGTRPREVFLRDPNEE